MNIYIYKYTWFSHVCISMFIYIYIYIYICIYIYKQTHIYTCIRAYIFIYIHKHVGIQAFMYIFHEPRRTSTYTPYWIAYSQLKIYQKCIVTQNIPWEHFLKSFILKIYNSQKTATFIYDWTAHLRVMNIKLVLYSWVFIMNTKNNPRSCLIGRHLILSGVRRHEWHTPKLWL